MTTRQIGKEIGVGNKTVCRWLASDGVPRRNAGCELIYQLEDRDWLENQYSALKKSAAMIAKEIGCSSHSVGLWLRRHKISIIPPNQRIYKFSDRDAARLNMSLAKRGKYIGSENPNWRGGIQLKDPERGRYRYKMWTKAVKDRDGWACTKCSSTERLHSHHIKRWCDYPDLRYDLSNGITLCHPCHEEEHGKGYKFRWPKHAEISTSAPASQEV